MKKILKWGLIVLGILLASVLLYYLVMIFLPDIKLYLKTVSDEDKRKILASVRSHGFSTGLLLISLMIIFSAVPGFPVSVVGIFSGVCFGPEKGILMNILGISIGNILTYYLIKRFKLINKKSNSLVKTISHSKYPGLYITGAFMIPFIPSFLINYTADSLKIEPKKFVWMVLIGAIPSSVLYGFGGDAIFKGNIKQSIILIGSVVVLALLILLFKGKEKNKATS